MPEYISDGLAQARVGFHDVVVNLVVAPGFNLRINAGVALTRRYISPFPLFENAAKRQISLLIYIVITEIYVDPPFDSPT